MQVRSSRSITVLCRDLYMMCQNDRCGGTYTAQLSIVNIIHGSATPNPEVAIPRSPRFHAPRPANDRDPIGG
jgi:hypothetical protein